MNSIHTLQDTVFQKMFLPSFSSIKQLREYCWQLGNRYKLGKDIDYNLIENPKTKNVCFRNRKYYFKRFLELTGYDVSDTKTDFINIYLELKMMSTNLEYNKNPKYISPKPIEPENITRITMTEELLEICKYNASFELREFLIKNGLDINQKEKLKKLSELKQEIIMDTATIKIPRF
jgi:hypothetical protein